MGFIFYEYIGLIKPGSDASLDKLEQELKKEYANSKKPVTITRQPDGIVVDINNYKFQIHYSEDSHVLIESKEMANIFSKDVNGEPVEKGDIENCARRFEMAGAEDFDMDYFNDSLFIVECLQRAGAIVLNPQEEQ